MTDDARPATAQRGHLWVPAVLLAIAAVLVFDPVPFSSPVPAATEVPAWATDTTPVRRPTLEPRYAAAGFEYRCSDCHAILPSPVETDRVLTQHTEIELKHGINTRCFNCHHRTNRDAFVDDLGHEIPWNQPQLLCAKCHGPVYRDWQHGAHGRTNGFWDTTRGEQSRRKCIECHDPHQPPFPPMRPAPPPRTLRMGHQGYEKSHGVTDPLQLHVVGGADGASEEEH